MKHLFTGNTGAFFLFSPPFPVKEHNWVSWNNTCCGTIQETHILRVLLCLRWYPANISYHIQLFHIQAHGVGYRCAVQSMVNGMSAPEFWWSWPKLMGLASSLTVPLPMQSLGLASPANNPSLLFGCHWWAKWNSYIWLESGPAGIWLELMVSSWFTKTAVYCISLFCLNWSLGECSCLCSSRTQNARRWEELITKDGQT